MSLVNTPTLHIGIGKIDPDTRIGIGTLNGTKIADVCDVLKTDVYFTATESENAIPGACVDGRLDENGGRRLAPNSAAGTFSLVIADALTTQHYRDNGQNAQQHAANVYAALVRTGRKSQIGGHIASETHGDNNCGCGAEDSLAAILSFISDTGNTIREFITDLGIPVSDQAHNTIVSRSWHLLTEAYVVPGTILRDTLIQSAGRTSIEKLVGSHNEVALSINTHPETTLDRKKLYEDFGIDYQIFNLDLPALKTATNTIGMTKQDATAKYVAILYYNVATAAVLAGPSLRVVVR